jgi:hypothetical protein
MMAAISGMSSARTRRCAAAGVSAMASHTLAQLASAVSLRSHPASAG